MQLKLNRAFTQTLNSLKRGRLHDKPITKSCNVPWKQVTVDFNGYILLCHCDAWLPIPVGTVDDFDSFEDIWTSEIAGVLQDNIKEKKYTWCAVQNCGILSRDVILPEYALAINLDESCNLSCPSCRREMRMLDQGPEYDKKLSQLKRILGWLEKFEHPIHITLSGNGDPLASKIIRPMFTEYQFTESQTLTLKTNGLLIKKILEDSPSKKSIRKYEISVDAGSKDVYEKVRRPGKWEKLIENLEWLKDNRGSSNVTLYFVVQKDNFQDMQSFADLCEKFNFNGALTPLADWGTWNSRPVLEPDAYTIVNGTFLDHNITDPGHPQHEIFVSSLNKLKDKKLPFMSFSPFFNQFFNVTR
jgi:MoaA/NifB/PqqE/SkfB family radical SAM enzyme